MLALDQSHSPVLAGAIVLVVIVMVAWALQLMQAASDRKEFSLMLAGCMVCSAAIGLATVMVMTFTTADRLEAQGYFSALETCLLYTSPSPRDRQKSRMPSSA